MENKTISMQQCKESEQSFAATNSNKQAYMKPSINIMQMEVESNLMTYSGQHNSGQHHPTPIVPEEDE